MTFLRSGAICAWHVGEIYHTVRVVLVFLRCLGITNAAVWFGAAIFFTAAIAPSFYSRELLGILGEAHAGGAAQIAWERYFALQFWCGGIAVAHLIVERLYTGQLLRHWPVYLVVALFGWALMAGLWLQPKLTRLHVQTYGLMSAPQQRERAQKSYRTLHGMVKGMNAIVILGLFVHLIDVTSSGAPPRLIGTTKFRG